MRDYVRGKGWVGAKDGKPVDPTTGQPKEDAAPTEETKPVEREAFDPTLTLRAIQRVEHALHVKIGNTDFAAVERILVEEVVTPTKRAAANAALERAAQIRALKGSR